MTAPILRLCNKADNRNPTNNTTCIQLCKLLFCMRNLSDFRRSLATSDRPFLRKSGLFCGRRKVLYQADLAMINPDSLAASNRIAMNFDVGVWLPSPVLSSGTSGFTSG